MDWSRVLKITFGIFVGNQIEVAYTVGTVADRTVIIQYGGYMLGKNYFGRNRLITAPGGCSQYQHQQNTTYSYPFHS